MSTLDKYRKIPSENAKSEEHEIRVTANGRVSNYISYAAKLFLEKKLTKCIIKGSGPAISKVCMAAEILRQRIKGLHEENRITSINIVDVYEPLEEGLDTVKLSKSLTVFEVILALDVKDVDIKAPGYQEPLPESEVKEFSINYSFQPEGGMRRGGMRRGGRRGGRRGDGRRGGRRGGDYGRRQFDEDDDYNRRPRREENNDDYYDRPRRSAGRGGRRGGQGYENRDRNYDNRERGYDRERNYDNRQRNYGGEDRPQSQRRGRGTRRGQQ